MYLLFFVEGMYIFIMDWKAKNDLEKENEQLKARLCLLEEENASLKEKNKILSDTLSRLSFIINKTNNELYGI